MSVCKSCKAPIVWANTDSGARIPLDAEPDPDRHDRVRPVHAEGGGLTHVAWQGPFRIVRATPGAGQLRTHYVTCPNAKQHRKAKP